MTVLTDDEIEEILRVAPKENVGWATVVHQREWCRAVEAAVLAKQKTTMGGLYGAVQRAFDTNEYVTEREARTRERAAYRLGHDEGKMGASSFINTHFPLPKCDRCGQEVP